MTTESHRRFLIQVGLQSSSRVVCVASLRYRDPLLVGVKGFRYSRLCFGGGSESLCRNAAGRSDDDGEIKQQIWNLVECTTQRE
jgi:hypothetical protein